jgi:hypothetical protein
MVVNLYASQIFDNVKLFKRFEYLDSKFLEDLNTLFSYVPRKLRQKLYDDILVYSITCATKKSLETFIIPDNRVVAYKRAYDMVHTINRNCLNNYYKFY